MHKGAHIKKTQLLPNCNLLPYYFSAHKQQWDIISFPGINLSSFVLKLISLWLGCKSETCLNLLSSQDFQASDYYN